MTLAPSPRLALIEEVYDACLDLTGSFEEDHVGADLAYLLGAMAKSGLCEWPDNRTFVRLLRQRFSTDHAVWAFIKLTPAECPRCGAILTEHGGCTSTIPALHPTPAVLTLARKVRDWCGHEHVVSAALARPLAVFLLTGDDAAVAEPEACAGCGATTRMRFDTMVVATGTGGERTVTAWMCDACGHAHWKKDQP